MRVRTTWRGRQVAEAVEDAVMTAMTATLEATAERAKQDHPGWKSRTGEAERSIEVEPPERDGTAIVGRVVGRARHFPFLEGGTKHMPAARTLERAGERECPQLERRIRSEFEEAK